MKSLFNNAQCMHQGSDRVHSSRVAHLPRPDAVNLGLSIALRMDEQR